MEEKRSYMSAAAALAVAFSGLNQAGLQAAARSFPGDFVNIDRSRTGRGRNDLKDGQSVLVYPANGERAMARRRRQMERAALKASS